MPFKTTPTTFALLAISLTLVGCETTWMASNTKPAPVIQPEDFIGEPQPVEEPVATDDETRVNGDEDGAENEQPPSSTGTSPRPEQALPVDAMVGHINGEAVYADQIFDVNLIAQLESFGRRFDGDAFKENASGVIQDRLQGIIINKLILGEAERNLKENQRFQIDGRIQAEREELLRFYGQGSLAKAKAEFRKDREKELDRHLVEFREELVIGTYIRSKVMPKIVVNQRDVERYYADNIEKFQKPDQRIIRLMIAKDEASTEQIKQRLGKGQAFEKVAADPEINLYNPTNGGIFNNGKPNPGNNVLSDKTVNDALLKLNNGEHAGPIESGSRVFFVQVVELIPGHGTSLPEAQIGIEQLLRTSQFEKQALRFRLGLLKRGSYSNPSEMGDKLLAIAQSRYDQ